MVTLSKFKQEDFKYLKSWISSEEDLIQFAGPLFTYPLTDQQLLNYIQTDHFKPYKVTLNETGEAIGHCELNFENGNNRLSRILIGNKSLRGKKIGEEIVRELLNLISVFNDKDPIDLNVFSWNKNAIKCYEKVGFVINANKASQYDRNGEIEEVINMEIQQPIATN
ncbi:MAG: RimJ/RimL family protein N-acetyltransferase [Glaciecola sp.]|jgi:RimJ/RimL family protein N-acetyltransferase